MDAREIAAGGHILAMDLRFDTPALEASPT